MEIDQYTGDGHIYLEKLYLYPWRRQRDQIDNPSVSINNFEQDTLPVIPEVKPSEIHIVTIAVDDIQLIHGILNIWEQGSEIITHFPNRNRNSQASHLIGITSTKVNDISTWLIDLYFNFDESAYHQSRYYDLPRAE